VWLDRSGDYDGAIASYDLAIYRFANELDPDIRCAVAEAIVNRGGAFRSTGRTLKAVSDHERVISTYADDVKASSAVTRAKTELGLSLIALGRHAEALARFDQVVAAGSHDRGSASDLLLAQALCGKGLALTELGRLNEALAAYETVIATFVQDEAPAAVSFAREKITILRDATIEV
jgi:tetratricopeptide (TPR) repeat protein